MKQRYCAPEMKEIEFRLGEAIAYTGSPNSAWVAAGTPCSVPVFNSNPDTKDSGCKKIWFGGKIGWVE